MASALRQQFRDPTADEKEELRQFVVDGIIQPLVNLPLVKNRIDAWLDAHPDVRVDTDLTPLLSRRPSAKTMFPSLYFFAITQFRWNEPILKKLLRRNPDPTLRNSYNQTATDFNRTTVEMYPTSAFARYRLRMSEAQDAEWDRQKKVRAALTEVAAAAPVLAKKGLPPDVENQILSTLTGQSGNAAVQMSKLRSSIGVSGVPSGGRRKTRRRKTKSRR
jgi:hypothetical protein